MQFFNKNWVWEWHTVYGNYFSFTVTFQQLVFQTLYTTMIKSLYLSVKENIPEDFPISIKMQLRLKSITHKNIANIWPYKLYQMVQ